MEGFSLGACLRHDCSVLSSRDCTNLLIKTHSLCGQKKCHEAYENLLEKSF